MSIFQDYVTSTAFSLTLSKNQIACLCAVEQLRGPWGGTTGSSRSILHKGLISHRSEPDPRHPDNPHAEIQIWELTAAGKALIPLIKLAGLYVEYPKMTFPDPEEIRTPMVRLKTPQKIGAAP